MLDEEIEDTFAGLDLAGVATALVILDTLIEANAIDEDKVIANFRAKYEQLKNAPDASAMLVALRMARIHDGLVRRKGADHHRKLLLNPQGNA
jgi:hypothetical protein